MFPQRQVLAPLLLISGYPLKFGSRSICFLTAASAENTKAKAPEKPKPRMRALFWEKVDEENIGNTVWQELGELARNRFSGELRCLNVLPLCEENDESASLDIDVSQLEKTFAMQEARAAKQQAVKKPPVQREEVRDHSLIAEIG